MKKVKLTALALVATATLAACSSAGNEAQLPVTGAEYELGTYLPSAHGVREELVTQHLAGADVADELADICVELAGLEDVFSTNAEYADQWVMFCESPDYVWDAYTDVWVPAN